MKTLNARQRWRSTRDTFSPSREAGEGLWALAYSENKAHKLKLIGRWDGAWLAHEYSTDPVESFSPVILSAQDTIANLFVASSRKPSALELTMREMMAADMNTLSTGPVAVGDLSLKIAAFVVKQAASVRSEDLTETALQERALNAADARNRPAMDAVNALTHALNQLAQRLESKSK